MRERGFSVKILVRRVKLIEILHKYPALTLNGIGARLGVSRWTVWRDMSFLFDHECLSLKKSEFLYTPVETFKELFERFEEAHSKSHSCIICEALEARRKRRSMN